MAALDGGAAGAPCGRSSPAWTATPWRRRSTSTASWRSSTTCCTTSTGRRCATRSRCACRSSTTSVVEYCARIPPDLKVRRLKTKHVLRHAARGLVPDRVIDKQKIGFFRPAVEHWFGAQTGGPVLRVPARARGRATPSSSTADEVTTIARTGVALGPRAAAPAARDPDARGVARTYLPRAVAAHAAARDDPGGG